MLMTAAGIEALIVSPDRIPRYMFAVSSNTLSASPINTALTVSSATFFPAGTVGAGPGRVWSFVVRFVSAVDGDSDGSCGIIESGGRLHTCAVVAQPTDHTNRTTGFRMYAKSSLVCPMSALTVLESDSAFSVTVVSSTHKYRTFLDNRSVPLSCLHWAKLSITLLMAVSLSQQL